MDKLIKDFYKVVECMTNKILYHENINNKENVQTGEILDEHSKPLELKPNIASISIEDVRKIISENINSTSKDKYKILIVDDEYVNLKVLRNYLSNGTFELLEASSGKEALRLVEENVDLDLVDNNVEMFRLINNL